MAVKIVRQSDSIAILGAPTSAAATMPGRENAPQALRNAGLLDQLKEIGYTVKDYGDDPSQNYQADEQNPRSKNTGSVLKALEALKPRVEMAVKSGALPLILSGDSSVAMATVAGVRRYFRNVGMIYIDRDTGLGTPATTETGSVDEMVVSHLTGRGASELVRFWGEPPLVREPDLALFGTFRISAGEADALQRSPVRNFTAADIQKKGSRVVAETALERIHAGTHEFVLHLDVDAIADFQATDFPGSGGLTLDDVRDALRFFGTQKHLAALEICGYNPAKDSSGAGAKTICDLLADVLTHRLKEMASTADVAPAVKESVTKPAADGATETTPVVNLGEGWSSDQDNLDAASSEETASDEVPPEQSHS